MATQKTAPASSQAAEPKTEFVDDGARYRLKVQHNDPPHPAPEQLIYPKAGDTPPGLSQDDEAEIIEGLLKEPHLVGMYRPEDFADPRRRRYFEYIQKIVREGDRDESPQPPPGKHPGDAFLLTDLGNAQRLVARYGLDLRYCEEQGIWYAWNGRRWAPSKGVAVERRAKDTIRAFHHAAIDAGDEDQRRHAVRSESGPQILSMVRLARSEPDVAVEIADLDADPYLFGCLNGVLDTRTGDLLPHNRDYLITKIAPVEYDPDATFALWDKFLDDTTGGDDELKLFLARAVGCSLTGEPADDDRFFFIHGPPAGGKTTFVEAVLATLGGYGQAANFDLLLKHYNVGGTRPDLVRLRGARFVSIAEIPEGKQLDEEMLKRLVGGDTIAAHAKYENEIEFVARCKLWVAGNHEPVINDGDSATWRRILKVPFTHVIAEADRDPQVKKTLRESPEAKAAIIAWAVKGCLDWRQRGNLDAPASVTTATKEYRESQDIIQQFIGECCITGEGREMELGEGYQEFSDWCRDGGIKHGTTRTRFTQRIKTIIDAPDVRKSGSQRYVAGIELLPDMRTRPRLDPAYDEYRDGPDNGDKSGADF